MAKKKAAVVETIKLKLPPQPPIINLIVEIMGKEIKAQITMSTTEANELAYKLAEVAFSICDEAIFHVQQKQHNGRK